MSSSVNIRVNICKWQPILSPADSSCLTHGTAMTEAVMLALLELPVHHLQSPSYSAGSWGHRAGRMVERELEGSVSEVSTET